MCCMACAAGMGHGPPPAVLYQETWRLAGLLARGVVGGWAAELSPHTPLLLESPQLAPASSQPALMEGDQSPAPEQASALALQMLSKPPA